MTCSNCGQETATPVYNTRWCGCWKDGCTHPICEACDVWKDEIGSPPE